MVSLYNGFIIFVIHICFSSISIIYNPTQSYFCFILNTLFLIILQKISSRHKKSQFYGFTQFLFLICFEKGFLRRKNFLSFISFLQFGFLNFTRQYLHEKKHGMYMKRHILIVGNLRFATLL